jgi:putative protease
VFSLDQARAQAPHADEISLDVFLRHPTPPTTRVKALIEELSAAERRCASAPRPSCVRRSEDPRQVARPRHAGRVGHLGLVAELARAGRDVVADYAVNCFNQHSAAEIFRLGARRIVPSIELTVEEMAQVPPPWDGAGFEVFVYGARRA